MHLHTHLVCHPLTIQGHIYTELIIPCNNAGAYYLHQLPVKSLAAQIHGPVYVHIPIMQQQLHSTLCTLSFYAGQHCGVSVSCWRKQQKKQEHHKKGSGLTNY